MKMISSAKVHKSERDLRRLLPFKNQIKSIMGHLLAADGDYTSPLTEEREVSKVGIVVFGSDDGLCGAYNVNIFKQMLVIMNNYREQYGDSTSFTVFPVGKKMLKAVKKIDGGFISVKSVKGVDSKMTGDKVTEFTEELKHAFISGELDKVIVVYMNFKSISRQILTEEQLFPVEASALGGELDAKSANKLYIFEPDGNRIFNEVLPMFVLSTMQEITIENRASEQAARIMAMQSANDNAKKLLESLRLEYNKLRQQSITTELLDILGGQVEK
jgi:F-type H+-transporting ATPase subunit gamma